MDAINTDGNREFAAAVRARMAADSRIVGAKAAMWRLTGVSAVIFALGAGTGLAALGFARLYDKSTSAEIIATALTKSLQGLTVKTEGEVRIDPKAVVALADGAVVGMAPGSTVALAPGGVVSLDPKAKVGVTGSVGGGSGGGSEEGLRARQEAFARSGKKVVSNFTRFHTVPWNNLTVVTGWEYKSSEDEDPSAQFCYTQVKNEDGEFVRIDLGVNGVQVPKRSSQVNTASAYEQCFWYNTPRTKAY